MTYDDQERIQQMKAKKMIEQNFCCAACGKVFNSEDVTELAHILPQRKWLIELYGKELIHHPENMKLTHSGACNSAVQISPNKTALVEAHIKYLLEH